MAQSSVVFVEGSVLKVALYRTITNSQDFVNCGDQFTVVQSAIAMVGVPGHDIPCTPNGVNVEIDPSNEANLESAPAYVLVQGIGRP